ncbi:MAG: GreA/GreB family elongation factor [Candidatus Kerfeldbacteria bacterium]
MRLPIRKQGKYSDKKSDLYITEEKAQKYKEELDKLKKFFQPHTIIEVKRLAEMGDFSENAAYQMAKGKLRGINSRILKLETAINKAIVIKVSSQTNIINIGHRVVVEMDGVKKEFKILGSAESDPSKGIISHTSPLGTVLIGKKVNDIFNIEIANKEVKCKILKIK